MKQSARQLKSIRPTSLHKNAKKNSKLSKKVQYFSVQDILKYLRQPGTIGLVIFSLILVSFFHFFGTHQVSGQSMAPTFASGERILIQRGTRLTRYTIVTFEPKDSPGESYVKRVVGLPGDRIQVDGNALFLLPKEQSSQLEEDFSKMTSSELPSGVQKITISEEAAKALHRYQLIPEGNYFVLGDNRRKSNDSRVFGFVNEKQIEGVVFFRYYPFNKIGRVH